MSLVKESKELDFSIRSDLWSEQYLSDFSRLMKKIKEEREKKLPVTINWLRKK